MRIKQVTFGCRLNRAESLDEGARLEAMGHTLVERASDAGLIIVRCCSVTAKAERDCRRELGRLRKAYPNAEVRAVGCIEGASREDGLSLGPALPLKTSRAYLKVQDGCAANCAYCIVPRFRGTPRSVPFADVMERARAFAGAGYSELVLTGCNLALYRSAGKGLAELADALAKAVPRLRIGSVEPGPGAEGLVEAMAENPNICRFLHISLQSASQAVLRRMGRPYGAGDLEEMCLGARRRLGARLMLGADAIAGFPGESESDFAMTRDFLRRHGFANVHAFAYSERPGTAAAAMDGAIEVPERRRRAHILSADGREARETFAKGLLGQEVEIAVERVMGGVSYGWSSEYVWTGIEGVYPRRSLAKGVAVKLEGGILQAKHVNREEVEAV